MKTPRRFTLLVVTSFIAAAFAVGVSPTTPVSASTCQATGVGCAVGMTGPNGGIIFYDAGSQQWWGRFLEAEQTSTKATGAWGLVSGYGAVGNTALQRQTMAIGMGRINTAAMLAAGSPLAMDHASADWFIPSKDELDALYDFSKLNSRLVSYGAVPVWTSSESEDAYAWYQLFHDGTQFTDANGIIPKLKSNKMYQKSAKHVGSSFAPAPMHVIRVRAFPNAGAQPPAASLVTAATDNLRCAIQAIECRIGDIGPGGGIVVYDAGAERSWGRYLEIAPKSCETSRVAYSRVETTTLFPTAAARVVSKAIGMGATNTRALNQLSSPAAVAASGVCNGISDWFLPSKGELNEAFRWLSHSRKGLQLTPVGQFERGYYWTSSDYNGKTAWTQYFADGQQFDRVQTLSGNRKPPARPFYVRPMRAFAERQVVARVVTAPSLDTTERSLFITGSRATVNGRSRIRVEGTVSGFPAGTILKAWMRFPGQTAYTEGNAQIVVGQDGTFTWSRTTGKKTYVYVRSPDGATSNRVIIPAK